jgi:hypothetical protein
VARGKISIKQKYNDQLRKAQTRRDTADTEGPLMGMPLSSSQLSPAPQVVQMAPQVVQMAPQVVQMASQPSSPRSRSRSPPLGDSVMAREVVPQPSSPPYSEDSEDPNSEARLKPNTRKKRKSSRKKRKSTRKKRKSTRKKRKSSRKKRKSSRKKIER